MVCTFIGLIWIFSQARTWKFSQARLQSASGKKVSVDWSQAGATITYEYVIKPNRGSIGNNYRIIAYKYEYINGSQQTPPLVLDWSLLEQDSYNETTSTTYSESNGSTVTLVVNVKKESNMLKSTRISGPSASIYGIEIRIWHHGTSKYSPVKFYLSND